MTPAIADVAVRSYLEAVRAQLGDLDPEVREHLLSDTEASLLEAEVELAPEVRLGPPERFARELRAAAGLPEVPSRVERPALLARLASHPRVLAARGVARELAPVWWVARGYVAFTTVAQLLGDDWSARYPVLTSVLGNVLGWLLALAAIAGSVALGRRERRTGRRWPRLLNAAAVLATLWLAMAISGNAGAAGVEVVHVETPVAAGLTFDGRPIDNVYPYDRKGRLLHDVRLYDQAGTPLEIRRGEGRPRRVVEERRGSEAFNAFPIRYFDRGTRRVRRPQAGAPEAPRPIVTPALRQGPG